MTSSSALLHNGSYTYAYFFWILNTIKIKFSQIVVYFIKNICNIFLVKCWRLRATFRLSDPFMTLLKWQYSEIKAFLIADIYHFYCLLIHLFKKMKHWNLDIIGYIKKCTLFPALILIIAYSVNHEINTKIQKIQKREYLESGT